MEFIIDLAKSPLPDELSVEIVERKGLGHPDTLCDALAEQLSLSLCRYYQEHFGLILHHNVDKVLLWGGAAAPAFGGGEVIKPIEVFLAGRATGSFKDARVPVHALAIEGTHAWFRNHLHAFDPEHHLKVHCLTRPGSVELVELYLRQQRKGVWLANDTSCGVGFAPLSKLETLVYQVEAYLNSSYRDTHPEVGEDIKVMGVRKDEHIYLTIACALVGRYIADVDDYVRKKAGIAEAALKTAQRHAQWEVSVEVNTADDPIQGSVYLTVTGTSAEAGDDGEAGRGNRVNGLITPFRPMAMESAAGKNPVTHVGKLYNMASNLIAAAIVEEVPGVVGASCYLVSQIGQPIHQPQIAHIELWLAEPRVLGEIQPRVYEIARDYLTGISGISQEILSGRLAIDRWPLRI